MFNNNFIKPICEHISFLSWAGTCAVVFLRYFMEINIRIVTNAVKFWIVGAITFVRNQGFDFVADEAPTVSLYHHLIIVEL